MIVPTLQLVARSFAGATILSAERFTRISCPKLMDVRNICLTPSIMKEVRSVGKREKVRVAPEKEMRMKGEDSPFDISQTETMSNLYPDVSTPNMLFNGVPYKLLHVVNVKITKNNTIVSVTDFRGKGIILHSSGTEGFKNARKGTNVAAQQAVQRAATHAMEKGINNVKVRIQGIGPGRLGAVKGLELSGINIVSLTDDTRVSWNPQRPRKQRRL